MAEHSNAPGTLSPPEPSRHTSLQDTATQASEAPSRSASTGDLQHLHHKSRERPRVRFTGGGESLDTRNQRTSFHVRDPSGSPPPKPLPGARVATHRRQGSNSGTYVPPNLVDTDVSSDVTEVPLNPPIESAEEGEEERWGATERSERNTFSQATAQERAQRLATMISHSAPGSRTASIDVSPNSSPPLRGSGGIRLDDIPLIDLKERGHYDDSTDEDQDGPSHRTRGTDTSEAHHLVRAMTRKNFHNLHRVHALPGLLSGQVTPEEEQDPHHYVPLPKQYRGGILSSLLKLYDQQGFGSAVGGAMPSGPGVQPHHYRERGSRGHSTDSPTPVDSQNSSGKSTPKMKPHKWYDKSPSQSTTSLAGLISSSNMMASPGSGFSTPPTWKGKKPGMKDRKGSSISAAVQKMKRPRLEDEIHITVHIAEILSRQKYLIKLCRALMTYGAPTHRLEGKNVEILT
jgi:hypothetical protein